MDKESRKQQIIQCACAMFAQDGYDATSLAQIAKGCGCSPSLIIRHFGSKENLYGALLQELEKLCLRREQLNIPEGSALERLEYLYFELIRNPMHLQTENPLLVSAIESRVGYQKRSAHIMRKRQDVGMELLLPVIRDGIVAGELPANLPAEQTARALWLYISGHYMIHNNYPYVECVSFDSIKQMFFNL